MLLEEAILEAQFVDDVLYEKVIKSAKFFSVDMKSFETTVKCPTCNAVTTHASVDDKIMTCEACGSMSTECTTISLTNVVVKDTDTSDKFHLVVDYAVLKKVFHTAKNKVEPGKQMLRLKIKLT